MRGFDGDFVTRCRFEGVYLVAELNAHKFSLNSWFLDKCCGSQFEDVQMQSQPGSHNIWQHLKIFLVSSFHFHYQVYVDFCSLSSVSSLAQIVVIFGLVKSVQNIRVFVVLAFLRNFHSDSHFKSTRILLIWIHQFKCTWA